jgi:hypothetical protein
VPTPFGDAAQPLCAETWARCIRREHSAGSLGAAQRGDPRRAAFSLSFSSRYLRCVHQSPCPALADARPDGRADTDVHPHGPPSHRGRLDPGGASRDEPLLAASHLRGRARALALLRSTGDGVRAYYVEGPEGLEQVSRSSGDTSSSTNGRTKDSISELASVMSRRSR